MDIAIFFLTIADMLNLVHLHNVRLTKNHCRIAAFPDRFHYELVRMLRFRFYGPPTLPYPSDPGHACRHFGGGREWRSQSFQRRQDHSERPGPSAPESGWPHSAACGGRYLRQLTKEAILKFQKAQFPEGHERANHTHWDTDGLIDIDKWTIARLNEILNKVPLLARAREWSGVALDRVRLAIVRLFTVRASYSLPNPLFTNNQLKREADWCFKSHKVADPVAHLDSVLSVYDRMSKTLHRYLSGSFPLFQLSDTFRTDAIAYAYLGGYEWPLDEREPTSREQGAYIYIGNDTFNGPNVIVHELGHYCGGRVESGKKRSATLYAQPQAVRQARRRRPARPQLLDDDACGGAAECLQLSGVRPCPGGLRAAGHGAG